MLYGTGKLYGTAERWQFDRISRTKQRAASRKERTARAGHALQKPVPHAAESSKRRFLNYAGQLRPGNARIWPETGAWRVLALLAIHYKGKNKTAVKAVKTQIRAKQKKQEKEKPSEEGGYSGNTGSCYFSTSPVRSLIHPSPCAIDFSALTAASHVG